MSSKIRGMWLLSVVVLCLMALNFTGCAVGTRAKANRVYDFADIVQFGVGLTHENPKSGVIPPALGVHAQLTEFINLGALTYAGAIWEMDGRGFYQGREERFRAGLGPIQILQFNQDYVSDDYYKNYFKQSNTIWGNRMNSRPMRWLESPAKEVNYLYWSEEKRIGKPVFPRGWHYWENIGLEVALSEPFITHWGFILKLGIDPSEISDSLLGLFNVDFKKDDLSEGEYFEMMEDIRVSKLTGGPVGLPEKMRTCTQDCITGTKNFFMWLIPDSSAPKPAAE